jgi:ribosomal-protein-alanine N-acetyltransferase
MALVIRSLSLADLPALEEIQRQNPSAAQWPAADYLGYQTLIAERDGEAAGFLALLSIPPDEVEILNLAVATRFHRQGVGSALMNAAGGRVQFLDVRMSNHTALAFYKRHGFRKCGHRRKYYSRPVEDAIMMRRELPDGRPKLTGL